MPCRKNKTGLILLAAGSSSRMRGRPKQLLATGGKSLLRRAAETAIEANFSGIKIVLGAEREAAEKEIEDLPVGVVVNENWSRGISSSIKAGLSAFAEADFAALVIMLCDQPLISPEILRSLCAVFAETGKPIAACRYENTIGVPALFAREMFGELMNLERDQGAKKIIEKHLDKTALISAPEAAFDVDTPQDFKELERFRFSNG